MTQHSIPRPESVRPLPVPPLPLFLLQPVLRRVVRRVAELHPSMFDRLGPHKQTGYVVDPVDLPFALYLRPDPDKLSFRAVSRKRLPAHEAGIAGKFLTLLQLVDADADGDSMFFSRDLIITGNTEAVVSLRNALDDVDGSVAEDVAGMFGPLGRAALGRLRIAAHKHEFNQ